MRICEIEGCDRTLVARSMCGMHYQRWAKYGDPNYPVRILGDDERRFWSYVQKTDTCWLWIGPINDHKGYGRAKFQGQDTYVHVYSFLLNGSEIPDGLELDHLCRVRNCVNPDHLEPVTHAENMRRGYWANRTHCAQGHPFEGDNLIETAKQRRCRTCKNESTRRSYWRKKADT